MSLFDQLKLLEDCGLNSNIVTLGSFLLSIAENHPDGTINLASQYQTMVSMGKSLHSMGEYRRAEAMFKKALQVVKFVTKSKSVKLSELFKEGSTEMDVKYAMAECNIAVREYRQAVSILESIPQRHRNARVNMALGKLYQQGGMERPAIVAYKEVLKECPLALDAIQELLSLGVSGAEISSMMLGISSNSPATEWISAWIKGHSHLHTRDYGSAITTFKHLEENSVLRKNAFVLSVLGETYYLAGDTRNALTTLQKSHAADPRSLLGVDLLACLLAQEKKNKELELLSLTATAVTDSAPQPWIAVGYYCQLVKRTPKAIYFAHKACSINPRSVEGLLLKGSLLLELKKLQEAVMHFREAMQIAPHRFEPHKGLVDCYLAMHRIREAATFASSTCKLLGNSARSLTLYASVLLKDSTTISKGKTYLDKALKEDPYYLPAVYLLCELYVQDVKYDSAIELLLKQVSVQSTYKLHQMLSDFHSHIQEDEKAAHHFSIAVNLNQESKTARPLEVTSRVDAPAEGNDMEVEEIADSEEEPEESVLEAVWSDVDFSFSAQ